MVRSLSIWVLLATAGWMCAQAPVAGPTAVTDGAGATLWLHEQGRTANKCKVLKTWLMPDGSRAYQAQSLLTGEMLTVVESGPAEDLTAESKIQSRATYVFHWSGSQTPPPGSPLPPDGTVAPPLDLSRLNWAPGLNSPQNRTAKAPPRAGEIKPASLYGDSFADSNSPFTGSLTGLAPAVARSATSQPQQALPGLPRVPASPPTNPMSMQSTSMSPNYAPMQTASMPPNYTSAPLGAGSVAAAGNAQYMPVPVVTVPDYRNPPAPPPARMPQPPQPTGIPPYSPPPAMAPINTSVYDANAFTPAPPPMPPAMTSNGFGPVNVPTGHPMPPQGAYPAMPPGMPPQGSYPAMPPGYPAMPPMGSYAPVPPMGGPVAPGMPQTAPTQPGLPMSRTTIDPGIQRAAMANAPQAIHTLRNALLPSSEMAVSQLVLVDWRSNSAVVQSLIASACEDPAASVRAACVRSLAQMHVNTVPVYSVLQNLRNDGDPRVQQEVEQALAVLAPGLNAATQPVQQVSGQIP